MSESFDTHRSALLASLDGFRVQRLSEREVAEIVLDRAPLNVVSMRQRDQLCAVFDELDHDDSVRVIVVRAQGRHFSSGGDIEGFLEASPEHVSRLAWNVAAPARCSKPVIAAIHGYCFGVAFELSLACDFRIVADDAELALPEMRIGMIPGSGGSARLAKMIGIARTKDMVMRARRLPAEQAVSWGIALEMVPAAALAGRALELAGELRAFSPLAQRTIKQVLNAGEDADLEAAIEIEGQAYGRLRGSDDFREGVESFKAKRTPVFRGS